MSLRISVIIPSYESAAWIEETLESITRQTYPADHVQVIVVDDASHDDSAKVARRFLERQRVRSAIVEHSENRGPAAARNSGLRVATGDFVQFLDADDRLAPHKLALQAECAASADEAIGVVYSSWQYLSSRDGAWETSGPLQEPFVDDDPVLGILAQPTFWFLGPTLIRRSELERLRGFVEKRGLGEDVEPLLRLAMAGVRFRAARSATATLFYRQWSNSLSRAYVVNAEAAQGLLDTLRRAEEFLRARNPNRELSADARAILAERYARWTAFFEQREAETQDRSTSWLERLGLSRPIAEWR
jgi:glycosyltransferase involved in cell wall biosynthesis